MIKPYHSRDEHGSGLDRTAVFLNWRITLDQTEKICCFYVIIPTISTMLLEMWFWVISW